MADAQATLSQLVIFVVRTLVDQPDAVQVEVREDAQGVLVALQVAPADMGKVIGRQGRIARALRQVVRAAAVRAGTRAMLDIRSSEPTEG
ncbi:MAG TPA: KH domain-containing protein [bacterium]